jgi:hypothetical protein
MLERFETEHYVFHFPRNSLAAKDILSIAETQGKDFRECILWTQKESSAEAAGASV